MNTLPQRKTLIQCVLTVLAPFLIVSCGGDSSSSTGASSDAATTVKKRDLVSYMYIDETSQPLKGNGIWNYSVATDYYYGSQAAPQSPSLAVDLKKNPQAGIEYVFATFISLSQGYNANNTLGPIPVINNQCPTNKLIPVITYYALPQINPDMYSGVLGGCVAGETATKYYADIFPNAPLKVVPVAEYADDSFPSLIANATSNSQISLYADALAKQILNDNSAYGLAIDNEKSINSYNKTLIPPSTTFTVGQKNEEYFFGELASKLASGGKYLFLFDAATSAVNLYPTNKNIVFMAPLYDLDNSDPTVLSPPPYNPDLLSQYKSSLTSVANGKLTTANGQSVMFVVPASATSTIWDYEMAYNYPFGNPAYTSPILNMPDITPNNLSKNCSSPPRDTNITDVVLNALIDPSKTIDDFFSPANCYLFTNTPNSLNDYFSASLQAITTARAQSNQQANYLGAAMYAWRISGMNDINAMKSYPSAFTTVGKATYLQGPPDIQTGSWATFNAWAPKNTPTNE